jgi:hypothetical protein
LRAKLKDVKESRRRRMHGAITEQGEWLKHDVRGFFNHHAVPTNGRALETFQQGWDARGTRPWAEGPQAEPGPRR